jgi:hypothetical protein
VWTVRSSRILYAALANERGVEPDREEGPRGAMVWLSRDIRSLVGRRDDLVTPLGRRCHQHILPRSDDDLTRLGTQGCAGSSVKGCRRRVTARLATRQPQAALLSKRSKKSPALSGRGRWRNLRCTVRLPKWVYFAGRHLVVKVGATREGGSVLALKELLGALPGLASSPREISVTLRALAFSAILLLACQQVSAIEYGWVPYVNERYGFSFSYPAAVFQSKHISEAGDGEAFAAIEGDGRLLVGAFENVERHTVQSYRAFVRERSYSGFDVSYAPRGRTWFVLSGESGTQVYYEKVMFSCGGRIINSFALIYPIASKQLFDPIVEGVENTFRPGRGCQRDATR